jgi:hypothetical protein
MNGAPPVLWPKVKGGAPSNSDDRKLEFALQTKGRLWLPRAPKQTNRFRPTIAEMPPVSNAPRNEPAPREGVLDWRGMWGFEIAI